MKNKLKSRCFLILLLLCLTVVLSSCSNGNAEDAKQIDNFDMEIIDNISNYFNGITVTSPEEISEAAGYTYTLNSFNVTKQRGDFPVPDWRRFEYDQHGNLINEYSFIIADCTITHEEDFLEGKNDYYLNTARLAIFDAAGNFVVSDEPLSSNNDKDFAEKDFYRCEILVGESITRSLVFIIPDSYLENNYLSILFNVFGTTKYETGKQCCIFLKEHSYEKAENNDAD